MAARFVGDGGRVIAAAAPPEAAAEFGVRFLVDVRPLQTMHYVVWVGFLPRFAPEAAAAFDARVPWLRGRRAWLVGMFAGAFFAVLFLSDYFAGRALYGALATYHAYLEFPVLLALLMSPLRLRPAVTLTPALAGLCRPAGRRRVPAVLALGRHGGHHVGGAGSISPKIV